METRRDIGSNLWILFCVHTLACHRVTGWWEDAGTQESLPEIGALIQRTGVNKLA